MRLVWSFAQWTTEQEKLLAQQGNLLALDDLAGFFSPFHCELLLMV